MIILEVDSFIVSYPYCYSQHIAEIARVLRPTTGRCVLLVQSHQHLVACLDSVYFSDIKVVGVNIGGYICSIVTAQRSKVEFQSVMVSEAQNGVEVLSETAVLGLKRNAEAADIQ